MEQDHMASRDQSAAAGVPRAEGEGFNLGPYSKTYTHGVGWSLHVPSDFGGKVPGATLRIAAAIGNERDADLLCASPDLFVALKLISEIAEHNSFVASAIEPSERALVVLGAAFVSVQEHARAAIAKALGGSTAGPAEPTGPVPGGPQ